MPKSVWSPALVVGRGKFSPLPATTAMRYQVSAALRLPVVTVWGERNDRMSLKLFDSSVTASAMTDAETWSVPGVAPKSVPAAFGAF